MLSLSREYSAFALFLVITLVAVPLYAYASRTPNTLEEYAIGDLQVHSVSVNVVGVGYGGPDLSLDAVVYNPNGFGATLNGANYSIYADGHYVGNGRTTGEYILSPRSTETFVLPVSIGWRTALQAMGDYLTDHGGVTWEIKGTADIEVSGLSLSVPFELIAS